METLLENCLCGEIVKCFQERYWQTYFILLYIAQYLWALSYKYFMNYSCLYIALWM